MRVLQRLVLPVDRDLDVLPLYVDEASHEHDDAARGAAVLGRHSLTLPPRRRVSLCTYFNAFPAAYWRRWSVVDEVVLRIRLRGPADVMVYRSSGKGHAQRVESVPTADGTVEVTLPLTPFIDGGWYWFDVIGGADGAVLESAEWCADGVPAGGGTATIGITTFNRPDFCVDQLAALGEAPGVLELLDEVIVVDQGTDRVQEHPGFAAAAATLGTKLRVIGQANLGGSGGFARAMAETLRGERSDYVLLLDDDVVLEPEGVIRAVAFADLARTPTIVGGHMFNLYDRSVLHTFGEGVEPYRWFYRPAPHTIYGHDFQHAALRTTPWLHRRADVDYNAWWMCLIPVDIIRKVGLALPLFIKWDDAEYGIRAKRAGFPTVSLPGAAVWHVPWHDKDDTLDWQAYFHARNRFVAGLLHSPYERGGNLVKESLLITAKHVLSMQYSTAELVCRALEDVLAGPDHLHASLASKIGEIRVVRAAFPDGRSVGDVDRLPPVRRRRPPRRGREHTVPEGRRAMVRMAVAAALKQMRPVDDHARRHPQTAVPHVDQRWWLLAQFDSALVSSADGTKVSLYQRDPARYRALAVRSAALHARLLREWPRLAREYRTALDALVSPERWRQTFGTGS